MIGVIGGLQNKKNFMKLIIYTICDKRIESKFICNYNRLQGILKEA